mgnify:CR=1 FL=1
MSDEYTKLVAETRECMRDYKTTAIGDTYMLGLLERLADTVEKHLVELAKAEEQLDYDEICMVFRKAGWRQDRHGWTPEKWRHPSDPTKACDISKTLQTNMIFVSGYMTVNQLARIVEMPEADVQKVVSDWALSAGAMRRLD